LSQFSTADAIVDIVGVSSRRLLIRERTARDEDYVVDLRNGVQRKIADGKFKIGVGGGRAVAVRDDTIVVELTDDGEEI